MISQAASAETRAHAADRVGSGFLALSVNGTEVMAAAPRIAAVSVPPRAGASAPGRLASPLRLLVSRQLGLAVWRPGLPACAASA